jgi:hypothetical protein
MAARIHPAPGPGRPKGCKNKFTDLKNAILQVVEEEGGIEYFREFMKKNPVHFFNAIRDLLPKKTEITGADGENIIVQIIKSGEGKNDNHSAG